MEMKTTPHLADDAASGLRSLGNALLALGWDEEATKAFRYADELDEIRTYLALEV